MAKTTGVLVSDLLRPARTISADLEIAEVLKTLRAEGLDFLSIVDGEDRLIGAVSENNFIRLVRHQPSVGVSVWSDNIDPSAGRQPIRTIMTTDITTIGPNENIGTAMKVMSSASYKLIHVIDQKGKLLGVVRIKDIFEKFLGV
jgi:CBS-domain-containing membrane protein